MTTPVARTTSDTARLLLRAPGYAVGQQEAVYPSNPAAGQGLTYTADGRYFERLLTLTVTLTTSAVVANRFIQLFLRDINGNSIISVPAAGVIPASSTVTPNLMTDATSFSNGTSGSTFGHLPDVLIPPGWSWMVKVFSMDVADQLSGAVLLVHRFPNDAASITAGQ